MISNNCCHLCLGMKTRVVVVVSVCLTMLGGYYFGDYSKTTVAKETTATTKKSKKMPNEGLSKATFGGGCFWCTEAVFLRLNGVERVVSGYSGGHVNNPTYQAVTTGLTGHAEVIQITYDVNIISFDELLEVFFKTHDPTTLNRQGNDVGTQYRSVVFYHDEQQRERAEYYKSKLDEQRVFDDPIVTEISELEVFYPAENYHQNYYALNKRKNPYCRVVITPKVDKLKRVFKDKLKPRKSS